MPVRSGNGPELQNAEAKAKEAAAKRAAEIRSVIETILNEPAPPG